MNASSCIKRFMIETSFNSISMHFICRIDLEININFFFLSIQRMINRWQLWFLEIPYNQRRLVVTYLSCWKPFHYFVKRILQLLEDVGANTTMDESKNDKQENNWFHIIYAAVPEWFAAAAFGLVTVFTLLLRNVPELQSNLLYVVHSTYFPFLFPFIFIPWDCKLVFILCLKKSKVEQFQSLFLMR